MVKLIKLEDIIFHECSLFIRNNIQYLFKNCSIYGNLRFKFESLLEHKPVIFRNCRFYKDYTVESYNKVNNLLNSLARKLELQNELDTYES